MSEELSILLVDDDVADAELTRSVIQCTLAKPFRTTLATNLREALAALQTQKFDVLLLDLGLPESSGLQTLARVREIDGKVPIVVFTGLNDEEKALSSLDHGAQDYLIKGEVSPNVLNRAIRHAIQRQQLLQELEESRRLAEEAKSRRLLDSAPDAMLLVDAAGTIALANQQVENIFGYANEQLIGQHIEMLVADSFHDEYTGYCQAYLADRRQPQETVRRELTALRRDGRHFPAEISLAPLETADGLMMSAAIRDLSERKQMEGELRDKEEQIRQAQKMEAVGRLAGGVAHDFNNLLTIIIGCAELIETDDPLNGQRELVREIRDAGERAASLTRQLLLFSRKAPAQTKVLSLNSIVVNMEKLLRRLIAARIELDTDLTAGPVWVKADPSQVEQIIMNLVVNACDAMPRGGRLTIRTASERIRKHATLARGEYVVLTVADTGCGMDAETLSRVFEPFFTTKSAGHGTGLGLATVYGIVQRARGQIVLQSVHGEGTTFKIYFPRVPVPGEEPLSANGQSADLSGNETVLVAEDEDAVRALIRTMLVANGYRVIEAVNAEEAFQIAVTHQEPIDVLVTDVVMPGMTGDELAHRLRKFRPETKAVFISGYTGEAAPVLDGWDESTQLVAKPFSSRSLLTAVRDACDQVGRHGLAVAER